MSLRTIKPNIREALQSQILTPVKKSPAVLSNDEMDSGDENDILNAPATIAYQNKLSINLTPSLARAKLKPGTTYWLKISAQEANGSDAGSTVAPFTVTAIGNYDALIYVSDAEKDSITFQVTINDTQYTLMGRKGGSENGAALYGVRFTDGEGRVLRTSYDNEVLFPSIWWEMQGFIPIT